MASHLSSHAPSAISIFSLQQSKPPPHRCKPLLFTLCTKQRSYSFSCYSLYKTMNFQILCEPMWIICRFTRNNCSVNCEEKEPSMLKIR